jgi:hypothetical protein
MNSVQKGKQERGEGGWRIKNVLERLELLI